MNSQGQRFETLPSFLGNKTDFALFRYFERRCSDVVDIVPLNRYTIGWIGGIVYVYDSKTGF